jgi:hypothetical protein
MRSSLCDGAMMLTPLVVVLFLRVRIVASVKVQRGLLCAGQSMPQSKGQSKGQSNEPVHGLVMCGRYCPPAVSAEMRIGAE